MKLFFSPFSPYARKVMSVAIAAGVDGQITTIDVNPNLSPPELLAANPLSKVPCLVTEDGMALFDSPVICEYLDSIGGGTLFPTSAAPRWRALKQQAIGDGMMDASFLCRMEMTRPEEAARSELMTRYKQAVARTLDTLEADVPADHLDIGTIAIACALGYLDLRFAADAWRTGRPKLTAWQAKMMERPEIARTAPPSA